MAKEPDYSRLAQVDYCIQQYYSRYLACDVIKTFDYAKKKRSEEVVQANADLKFIAPPEAQRSLVAQQTANLTGKWNHKSDDEIVEEIKDRWFLKDKDRQHDLRMLSDRFFAELIDREGGIEKFGFKGYSKDGQAVYQNKRAYILRQYANYYIDHRIYENMVNTLAKRGVPRSSAEYIAQKAFKDSMVGMIITSANSSGRRVNGTFNDDVSNRMSKLYNPSKAEDVTAFAGSLILDTATFSYAGMAVGPSIRAAAGGLMKGAGALTKSGKLIRIGENLTKVKEVPVYKQNFFKNITGSAKGFAKNLAYTGAFTGALHYGVPTVMKAFGYSTDEDKQNKIVFGDIKAPEKIANLSSSYRKYGTELIEDINSNFTKRHKIKTAGPTFNMTSKSYCNQILKNTKGYSYNLRKTIASYFDYQAIPYNSNAAVPSWMYAKSSKELRRMAASWYAIARQMSERRLDTVKLPGGHRVGLKYVAQKAFDYAHAAVETDRATWARKAACERAYQPKHHMVSHTSHSKSYEYTPSQSYSSSETNNVAQGNNAQYTNYNVSGQQQPQVQNMGVQGTSPNLTQNQDVSGWQKGLQENGMGDFGLNGQNLGYTLAMLPDMLISMFTGKNPNFKLENNYMPLSMIMLSLFLRKKNPMLSMLFLGLGGVQLLNNSCKSQQTAAQKEAAKSKQFIRYADEPLNPRIQNPIIRGRSLVATIDGKPLVVTIHNDEPLYCYQQGFLPINVLANSVLKSLDEQRQSRSLNYDRQQSLDNDWQQQLQIK